MATPARTMTPAPVPHAKPAHGVVVKTQPVKMEVLPPPTSFTPVKSPDQKRPKASVPAPASNAAPLRRSLCAEMDATTAGDRGGDHDTGKRYEASAGKDVLQLNSFLDD